MRKLLFLLPLCFILNSCCFYFSDSDIKDITKKTEIRDISNCHEPIVITMPVYNQKNLFGNEKLGSKYERLGDIFVVIDTQTNDLYDWVFCKNEEGSVTWRCVELGTNPKKYFSTCGSLQCCIQAGSTVVQKFKTDCPNRYMENLSSVGTKGLLIGNGYDSTVDEETYLIKVFDSTTGKVSEDLSLYTDSIGYMDHPIADGENTYYLCSNLNNKNYINKINTNTYSLEQLPIILNTKENINGEEKLYNYFVLNSHNDYIILSKLQLGANCFSTSLYLVNSNDSNMQNSLVRIDCPSEYYNKKEGAYFARGINYKNNFYSILSTGTLADPSLIIFKTNFETKKLENISGYINFDFTETIWLKDSKIYFMCSRDISNVSYMYFDLETKQQSEIFYLSYDKIVSQ